MLTVGTEKSTKVMQRLALMIGKSFQSSCFAKASIIGGLFELKRSVGTVIGESKTFSYFKLLILPALTLLIGGGSKVR